MATRLPPWAIVLTLLSACGAQKTGNESEEVHLKVCAALRGRWCVVGTRQTAALQHSLGLCQHRCLSKSAQRAADAPLNRRPLCSMRTGGRCLHARLWIALPSLALSFLWGGGGHDTEGPRSRMPAHRRWMHKAGCEPNCLSPDNCYSGNAWNQSFCPGVAHEQQ